MECSDDSEIPPRELAKGKSGMLSRVVGARDWKRHGMYERRDSCLPKAHVSLSLLSFWTMLYYTFYFRHVFPARYTLSFYLLLFCIMLSTPNAQPKRHLTKKK